MKTIQYLQMFIIRQNDDEVSLDGMDVHAAAYQRINHNIPMHIHKAGGVK